MRKIVRKNLQTTKNDFQHQLVVHGSRENSGAKYTLSVTQPYKANVHNLAAVRKRLSERFRTCGDARGCGKLVGEV